MTASETLDWILFLLVSDAVKNDSQIADRLSITMSTRNKKGLGFSVFTIRENH